MSGSLENDKMTWHHSLDPWLQEQWDDDDEMMPVEADPSKAALAIRFLPGAKPAEDESPTKRPQEDDQLMTVSSRELKALLGEHLREMKEAWGDIKDRVSNVEGQVKGQKKELKAVKHKAVDQTIMGIQAKGDATARKTEELEGEIERIKTQLAGLQTDGPNQGKGDNEARLDPWAEYLRRGDPGRTTATPSKDEKPGLSEEDQRSLIVGGWLADTRRLTIENEARDILEQPSFAALVDSPKLTIFGPRRSFGILRFKLRDNEAIQGVKGRMWEVVNKIRQEKIQLASTKGDQDEGKRILGIFPQDARGQEEIRYAGEAKNPNALESGNYDVDWSTGTIWHGDLKLASATHRKNHSRNDDYIQVNQGWVDVRAVTTITGAEWKEAVEAFEREQ
ncbi:pepD [Symbiodinium sp. CCMP2456]|nr:pepD [Symbiodinium sp. CCMP2456]